MFASLLVGQTVNLAGENDDIFPASGLDQARSDYVGQINATYRDWLDLDYRVRLDKDSFSDRSHELALRVGQPVFRLFVNYNLGELVTRTGRFIRTDQEINLIASSRFADYWTATLRHRRDLGSNSGSLRSGFNLTYRDECFTFALDGERRHTVRPGESEDEIFLRLGFRNIGEVDLPSFSPDIFSRGGDS